MENLVLGLVRPALLGYGTGLRSTEPNGVRLAFSTQSNSQRPSGDQCKRAALPQRGATLSPPTELPMFEVIIGGQVFRLRVGVHPCPEIGLE